MRFSSILLLISFCGSAMGEVRDSDRGWRHFPSCNSLVARFGVEKWVQPSLPNPKDAKLLNKVNRTAARTERVQELESKIFNSNSIKERKAALVERFLYGKAYSESTAIDLFFKTDTVAPFSSTKSYANIAASIAPGTDAAVRDAFEREIKKQLRERRK